MTDTDRGLSVHAGPDAKVLAAPSAKGLKTPGLTKSPAVSSDDDPVALRADNPCLNMQPPVQTTPPLVDARDISTDETVAPTMGRPALSYEIQAFPSLHTGCRAGRILANCADIISPRRYVSFGVPVWGGVGRSLPQPPAAPPGTCLPIIGLRSGPFANAVRVRGVAFLLHGIVLIPVGFPSARTGLPNTGLGVSPAANASAFLVLVLFLAGVSGLPNHGDHFHLVSLARAPQRCVFVHVVAIVLNASWISPDTVAEYPERGWFVGPGQRHIHVGLGRHEAKYLHEARTTSFPYTMPHT